MAESDIRRRFQLGLRNFFALYRPLADGWWMVDGSRIPPAPIAQEEDAEPQISQPDLYHRISESVKGAL